MNKLLIGFLTSGAGIFAGFILRLRAHSIGWAGVASWNGPASETNMARVEACYSELALVFMGIAGLILAVSFARWLATDIRK